MQYEASTEAYKHGHLAQAETILSKTIAKAMPGNNFQKSNDAVCLLLNRATTRFATSDVDGAIADYDLAIEALDYYAQESSLDIAGQFILEDGWGAYAGTDLEHLLARIYFALALLHKGDINNAYALLRQAEETQQIKSEKYAATPYLAGVSCDRNVLGKYLFAALVEHQGDLSNAEILYRQAQAVGGDQPSQIDLSSGNSSKKATLILLCHNGNVPYKISATSPASVASTVALEIILSTRRLDPAWSSLTGIPVPRLVQNPWSEPLATTASINNVTFPLSPYFNVAQASYCEMEQKKPLIVARGVARYLLRRSAVAYAQKQDPHLGALVDIGMLIANANTKADTRSWSTLPASIDLAHCQLEPGSHCLKILVSRHGLPNFEQSLPIDLKAGDFCIINIFNINPGTTKILVPSKYLSKGDPS